MSLKKGGDGNIFIYQVITVVFVIKVFLSLTAMRQSGERSVFNRIIVSGLYDP